MSDQGITVGGIPIPSREPWFLATVAVHVLAGLVAVVAGAVAMLSPKRAGRHPRAGTLYFRALIVISVTMSALVVARWPDNNHLGALGTLALGSAWLGRKARRQRWGQWMPIHVTLMGFSYILMMTAFYVDNGPHLPLWRALPTIAFWTLPAIIGLPLIVLALTRRRPDLNDARDALHRP